MIHTATKARCRHCKRKYALTDIGLVRKHTIDRKRDSEQCPGAEHYPLGVEECKR